MLYFLLFKINIEIISKLNKIVYYYYNITFNMFHI